LSFGLYGGNLGRSASCKFLFPSSLCWGDVEPNSTCTYWNRFPRLALRAEVTGDLRAVFDAPDRHSSKRLLHQAVDKYQGAAPKRAEWIEANVPGGLAVFSLPHAHRRRLRTSNLLDRLNQEFKRRTRVAILFPNGAALL